MPPPLLHAITWVIVCASVGLIAFAASGGGDYRAIVCWLALCVFAFILYRGAKLDTARQFRRRGRMRTRRCPRCNYDLRATPNRCPECGLLQPSRPIPPALHPLLRKSGPFSDDARSILRRAFAESMALHHHYLGTDHVLLAILQQPDSPLTQAMLDAGLTPDDIRESVHANLPAEPPRRRTALTPALSRILHHLTAARITAGRRLTTADLLAAMIADESAVAHQLLRDLPIPLPSPPAAQWVDTTYPSPPAPTPPPESVA